MRKKKRLPMTTLQGILLAIVIAAMFAAAIALLSYLNIDPSH
jgi:hypothetical protein